MSPAIDNLRVFIVTDDPLARAGLATLLGDQPGCTIVGQTGTDVDLLAELDVYHPDVALWDLGWDSTSTLDRLAELIELDFPVVALLPPETPPAEILTVGIYSLLRRDADADRLWAALQATAQGLATFEPELIPELRPARQPQIDLLVEELTPREVEVLQLLAEGLANKAIARQLGISEHTVKFHVNAILSKLEAQSRTEAVVRATRLGLLLL